MNSIGSVVGGREGEMRRDEVRWRERERWIKNGDGEGGHVHRWVLYLNI